MVEFRVKYDRRADVLYVSTERNGSAYAREGDDGVIWRYLIADDSLVGATVMDFDSYWKHHMVDLIDQISHQFSVTQKRAQDALEHADG